LSAIITSDVSASAKKPLASLKRTPHSQLTAALGAAAVAFLAYTAVYAYRKPFTVATFEGLSFGGIRYQTLLIISQGLGYMASKFAGIKFIAELKRLARWKTTAVLIGIAWLCLLVFAVVPAPWGMLCMFVNGFVLGFMWGIIFSYVEGRRATDFIGASMAISFIFAGGFTRSVAIWLRDQWHVSEQWLAFTTGLIFIVPLICFIYWLEKLPGPDEEDIRERTARQPMTKADRKRFVQQLSGGIIGIIIAYLFLTIMRDVRDNFMVNIWNELGYGAQPVIVAQTETITSLVILVMMSAVVFIRHNMRALSCMHGMICIGFVLAGIASALFLTGHLPSVLWMQLVGLGLYMGYIPINCIFFERLIAAFRMSGNVGFLIYLADAWGYLGSSTVLVSKELLHVQLKWVQLYPAGVVLFSVAGLAATVFSWAYFSPERSRRIVIES
jgi:hypothetical protein